MTEGKREGTLADEIKQLKTEVLAYVQKENELNRKQKLVEYGHMKRTISLIKIIEELNREISELKRAKNEKLSMVSGHLRERIRELNCLYDVSSLATDTNFSLDNVLQALVDFIPPAMRYPELACARISFDHYNFKTPNFNDTKWKLSQEIYVNNEQIGVLEVCYVEEFPEIEDVLFRTETKNLVASFSESIAQIIEREWAEIEIRKGRTKIETLIKEHLP